MSQTSAIAWGLWSLTGLVLLTATLLQCIYLAALACVLSAAAAVAHIKTYLCKQSTGYKIAYELGRDAGRLEHRPEVPVQRIH